MTIDRNELYKLYMEWVNRICEDIPEKTSFSPAEIISAIVTILENNPELLNQNK